MTSESMMLRLTGDSAVDFRASMVHTLEQIVSNSPAIYSFRDSCGVETLHEALPMCL